MTRKRYERLLQLRADGLSQREVALVLGVTQTAVCYREKHGWRDAASNRRMDAKTRARALEMRKAGKGLRTISREVGFSEASLHWFFKRESGNPRRRAK